MARIQKFENLDAWRKARELSNLVYKVTKFNQFARDYGLCNQIRRASVSVLSNIAEGFERANDKEFIRFLKIAKGSCGEVRAQLYIAFDLGYITIDEFSTMTSKATDVCRMIAGLIKYLQRSVLQKAGSKKRSQ